MSLYYDLHTHTHHSDGLLCPRDLVREAHASGIGGIALTDHDVTSGLEEASESAQELGLELIPGVEVSVTWGGQTIHIVGVRIDPAHPGLQAGLVWLQAVRHERAEAMGARLSRCGIEGVYQGVLRQSHGVIVGRTHFARYLVEHGFAKDIRQAFTRYLRKGGSGYVATKWASLGEAVGWIRAASGVAVIAHPARYGLTSGALRRLIEEFKEAGGEGIEVVSGSHNAEEVERFADLSLAHGLLASAGSDYHGPGETRTAVGRLQSLPARCTPVWSLWASS
ncbi:MAG: PHP domain-containing protein [Acidiferrobacteraceae bacterium]